MKAFVQICENSVLQFGMMVHILIPEDQNIKTSWVMWDPVSNNSALKKKSAIFYSFPTNLFRLAYIFKNSKNLQF